MRGHLVTFVAVVATALAAAACDSSKPATPTGSLSGVWAGSISEGPASGNLRMDVTQQDQGMAGTFTGVLAGAGFEGTVSGTLTGTRLNAFFTPSAQTMCPNGAPLTGTLNATLIVTGTRVTGQYTAFGCSGVRTGTIELERG